MATSTDTTAPAKKSNTMMYAAIAIIIIIVAGVAAYFAFFGGGTTPTPTVTLTLSGSSSAGWNGTKPGPTINVKLTDRVRINLYSADGGTHNFVIAYDNSTLPTPSSGDTVSNNFGSSSTASSPYAFDFTPAKAGYFKYYCDIHNTDMIGTIHIS